MIEKNKKVILITGGGGVLGGEIAKAFAGTDTIVILTGRTLESLDKKAQEIKNEKAEQDDTHVDTFTSDVLNLEALKALRDHIKDTYGRLDILVNAAGGNQKGATIAPDQTFFDLDLEAIEQVTELNFMGTVMPCYVLGPLMAEQKRASILNISSMASDRVITRVMGYSASKAAMENFTRSLAVEMALKYGEHIRVNALAPGFFIADQNRELLTNEDGSYTERGNTIITNTPMKRFGKPHEVAGAAAFLCSDEASFITATVLPVDGGFSAFSGV